MFIYKLPNTQRNVLYDASKAKISGFSEKTQIINVEIMIQASGDKNVCLLYMKWYWKEIENRFGYLIAIDIHSFDKNYKSEYWYSTIKGIAFHPTC